MVSNRQRAVVVTGASSGIGEACALRLDGLGFRVFAGVRHQKDADALGRRASNRLVPLMLDVTDTLCVDSAADSVAADIGGTGLAGLVNNAGIAVAGPLEFLPLQELRRQLEVNVVGQIAVTQAFLPLLREGEGGGRVVNVGSISGRIATPLLGAYTASKFAMEGLTDTLRRELRPWGIEVSIVEPGRVATPIWEKSLKAADELLRAVPGRAHELYGSGIEKVRRDALEAARLSRSPENVARAVEHALTAKRPRSRYPVGLDAWLGALLVRILPDPLLDRILSAYGV